MSNSVYSIIIGGDMDSDWEDLFSGKNIAQSKNVLYLDSFEELYEFLSPKRIHLLHHLMKYQSTSAPKSISTIALELNRFQEAISKDLKYLTSTGLVEVKKQKQTVYAYPKYKEIVIKTK